MTTRRRAAWIGIAAVLLLCALSAIGYLRWKQAPEIARLLPEADAVVYFNLKLVRSATHFDRNTPKPTAEYKTFIDATGIVPERDLDEGAVAMHRVANPYGPNGAVGFSEVFLGRFDEARLTRYLQSQARSQETYAGRVIYDIASPQGYLDRVAVLDEHRIAASNMPTAEQIHAVMDHASGESFAGSTLLRARHGDVPAFSSAWAVGRLGLVFAEDGRITVAGLRLPIAADSMFVASVRYRGGIRLRVDQVTASELEAAQSAQGLMNLLALVRALGKQQSSVPAMNQLLDSVGVEAKKDRATLTAVIPTELLQQVAHGGP